MIKFKFKSKKIGLILMVCIAIAGIPANVVKAQECPGGGGPACSPDGCYCP